MADRKINVGILFGGKSAEHEISLRSARNIIEALDRKKYNPILIGIDKTGKWRLEADSRFLLESDSVPKLLSSNRKVETVALVPQSGGEISSLTRPEFRMSLDVVIPVLHGPFGEDGTVQGLLKLANVPFVGAGVLGSAIGMDKEVMKRLLRDAKIPTAKFLAFRTGEPLSYEFVARQLGVPFFVKPANLGSSVGVSKVHGKSEFGNAVQEAFNYDRKILVEEYIKAREIECAVLGNENPVASVPGEIIVKSEFYSYEAKYVDETASVHEIPARIPKTTARSIQELAVRAFKTLSCEGLARVDFFLKKNGKALVNEINTMPGFTSISMYPRLWGASGLPLDKLVDRLIQLALERFEKERKLKTSYSEVEP